MDRKEFGDFDWGVATASYQIEGAHTKDGKGESIWDRFTHTPGKIDNGDHGDVACDHYHRFSEDFDIMQSLNIKQNRFSLAWTRLFPDGKGTVNEKGVDHYKRMIDACLERGIEPNITLYHWDLPQALEDQGGWTSREIVGRFSDYVDFCTKTFGDRIQRWMILNEPLVFTALGYMLGIHAPGRKGLKNFLPAAHHAALAQAEGGRITRQNCPTAEIGTTFSCSHATPYNEKPRHIQAAARFDAIMNRLFIDPVVGRGYPFDALPGLKRIEKYYQPGDDQRLLFDFDFIGIQNYTRDIVKASCFRPIIWHKTIAAKKRNVPITDMGWEVYPEGIYHLLKKFGSYKEIKKIYVTENGAAFPDTVVDDRVHDEKRIEFLKEYIGQVLKAKKEGVNVGGYFVWSFMDNFEWAEGYRPRFGLVHVNYETQKRTIKDSGYWYRDFLSSN